jgi:hypothetical protein
VYGWAVAIAGSKSGLVSTSLAMLRLDVKYPGSDPFADMPNVNRSIQEPTQAGIERIALSKQRGKLSEFHVVKFIHASHNARGAYHGLKVRSPQGPSSPSGFGPQRVRSSVVRSCFLNGINSLTRNFKSLKRRHHHQTR